MSVFAGKEFIFLPSFQIRSPDPLPFIDMHRLLSLFFHTQSYGDMSGATASAAAAVSRLANTIDNMTVAIALKVFPFDSGGLFVGSVKFLKCIERRFLRMYI